MSKVTCKNCKYFDAQHYKCKLHSDEWSGYIFDCYPTYSCASGTSIHKRKKTKEELFMDKKMKLYSDAKRIYSAYFYRYINEIDKTEFYHVSTCIGMLQLKIIETNDEEELKNLQYQINSMNQAVESWNNEKVE